MFKYTRYTVEIAGYAHNTRGVFAYCAQASRDETQARQEALAFAAAYPHDFAAPSVLSCNAIA